MARVNFENKAALMSKKFSCPSIDNEPARRQYCCNAQFSINENTRHV